MGTTTERPVSSLASGIAPVRTQARRTPTTLLLGLGLLGLPALLYLGWPSPIYDQQRIVQVFALLLAVLLAIARGQIDLMQWPRGTAARVGLAALLVGGVASVALAAAPMVAVRHTGLTLVLAFCTWRVAAEVAEHGSGPLHTVLALFAGLAAVTTLVFAAVAPASDGHPAGVVWHHARFLGQLASWLLPVLLGLTLMRRPAVPRLGLVLLSIAWMALAVFSGSRGTWIGLVLALSVGTVLAGRHRRSWLGLSGLTIALGIPLGLVLNQANGVGRTLAELTDDTSRLDIFDRTYQLWLQRPWFGVGPGVLSVVGGPPAHPHNAPLQLLTEWGLVATLGLTVLILVLAVQVWRTREQWQQRLDDPRLLGLVAGIVAAAVHSLVSGILVTPASQLLLVLVLGGVLGVARRAPRTTWRSPWALVAVLGVLGLGVGTVGTLPHDYERTVPRFWVVSPDSFRDLE